MGSFKTKLHPSGAAAPAAWRSYMGAVKAPTILDMGAVKAPTIRRSPRCKRSRPIGRPGQAADGPFPRQEPLAGLSSAVTGPGRRLNHRSDGVLGRSVRSRQPGNRIRPRDRLTGSSLPRPLSCRPRPWLAIRRHRCRGRRPPLHRPSGRHGGHRSPSSRHRSRWQAR